MNNAEFIEPWDNHTFFVSQFMRIIQCEEKNYIDIRQAIY